MRHRTAASLVLLATALIAVACASTPERTGLLAEQENVRATETEVWIRLDNFAATFIRTVEMVSDSVRAETNDPKLRRMTLEWKINLSNSVMQSTAHPDAVIAILDTWTLLYQMREFGATESFAGVAGDFQSRILVTFDDMLAQYDTMVRAMSATGDAPKAREFAQRFALEHPFERGTVRPSALDQMVAAIPSESRGALATVGALSKTLETVSSRVAIYTDLMPKMARWHAELVLEDPRYAGLIDNTNATLTDVRRQLDQITTIVADSPALDERFEVAVGSVVAGLAQAVDDLERIVNSQRTQVEILVDGQRALATDFVSAERGVILEALSLHLDRVSQRVDELAARTVGDAGVTAEHLVETAYSRAVRLLVFLLVGLLVLMLVHRFLYRRTAA